MNKIFLLLIIILIIYVINFIVNRRKGAKYQKAGRKWEGIVKELSKRK
tara:strand:+ start:774 stop:917 length:144 start_codon:yes stop_codon:yes gene_type:complete